MTAGAGFSVSLEIYKQIFGVWVYIPCVDNVGSCTISDLVRFSKTTFLLANDERVPPPLVHPPQAQPELPSEEVRNSLLLPFAARKLHWLVNRSNTRRILTPFFILVPASDPVSIHVKNPNVSWLTVNTTPLARIEGC